MGSSIIKRDISEEFLLDEAEESNRLEHEKALADKKEFDKLERRR